MSTASCADCPAIDIDDQVQHDPTCPYMGAQLRVLDADLAWFAAHPFTDCYRRPLNPADDWLLRVELRAEGFDIPPGAEFAGTVVITKVSPGWCVRDLSAIRAVPSRVADGDR